MKPQAYSAIDAIAKISKIFSLGQCLKSHQKLQFKVSILILLSWCKCLVTLYLSSLSYLVMIILLSPFNFMSLNLRPDQLVDYISIEGYDLLETSKIGTTICPLFRGLEFNCLRCWDKFVWPNVAPRATCDPWPIFGGPWQGWLCMWY